MNLKRMVFIFEIMLIFIAALNLGFLIVAYVKFQ